MNSESWMRAVNKQRARLDAHIAEKVNRTPAWRKHPQGIPMLRVVMADMLARVSQADDPTWFEPADPTVRAEDEAVKLAWAMNAVDTYAEASVIAIKMLGEWPKYKYAPSKPVETGP
jgi:hypothetical protein